MNRKDQRQLETVHRGQVDAAVHVAKSREAIEDSLSLLQRSDSTAGQKPVPRRRPSEGRGQDRAAGEKLARAVPVRRNVIGAPPATGLRKGTLHDAGNHLGDASDNRTIAPR
jgi:hypothetical protein